MTVSNGILDPDLIAKCFGNYQGKLNLKGRLIGLKGTFNFVRYGSIGCNLVKIGYLLYSIIGSKIKYVPDLLH